MSRSQIVIYILLMFVAALLLLRTYILVEYSILNYEYADIHEQIKDYEDKNLLLKESIYTEMSLTEIHKKAVKEGFSLQPTIYYLP